MTYMTFKIKKDWLFYTLFGISCFANLVFLVLLALSAAGILAGTELLSLSIAMTVALTAINGYLAFCLFKRYNLSLTTEGITIGDFSKIDIPYTSVRSISKDREPSKYNLYEALLIIKFNKFDTIKVNVEDLENCFDNLKELVQKANLGRKIKEGTYGKSGETLEISDEVETTTTKTTTTTTTTAAAKPATTATKPAPATTAAPKTSSTTTTTTTTAAPKAATKKVVTTTTTTTTKTAAPASNTTTTTK